MTQMLREIEEQPTVLLHSLNGLKAQVPALQPYAERLRSGQIDRVIFVGMGASFTAVYPTLLYLAERGISAYAVEANEFVYHYLPALNPRTLLVVISQSGKSVEIVKLLEQRDPSVPMIGITNEAHSPLAEASSLVLSLNVGEEFTVSSKTYTATLASLRVLGCALTGETVPFDELEGAARHMQMYLDDWRTQIAEIAREVVGHPALLFLGRSTSFASASTGALLVKESAKLPTEGVNSGQFRHGPIELVDEHAAIFIFAGQSPVQELNLKLAADVAGLGACVTLIGEQKFDSPARFQVRVPQATLWTLPMLEIIPMQLLAAQLAAERGLEGGKFRYIQKVTTHE